MFFSVIFGAMNLGQAGPNFNDIATAQVAAYHVFQIIDRVRVNHYQFWSQCIQPNSCLPLPNTSGNSNLSTMNKVCSLIKEQSNPLPSAGIPAVTFCWSVEKIILSKVQAEIRGGVASNKVFKADFLACHAICVTYIYFLFL